MLAPTVVGLWALGTMWIPGLVVVEIRRARRVAWHYERSRWSTVFPLGMYSATCSGLAGVLAGPRAADAAGATTAVLPPLLRNAGHVAFWVSLVAWCVVTGGLVRRGPGHPSSQP